MSDHYSRILRRTPTWPLLVLLSAPAGAQTQEAILDFTPLSLGSNGEVRFFAKASGTVSASSLVDASMVPSPLTEHGYLVEVDTASYRQDKNHHFAFDMYVVFQPDNRNADLYKFSVREDDAGKFSDGWANVTVKIAAHGNNDSTAVRLPVHCRDSDNLQSLSDKTIPIPMGNESTRTLDVKNALTDMHVFIAGDKGVALEDRNCPKCWQSLSGKVTRSDLAAGAKTTLELDLQPDTVRILKQNLLPPSADANPYQLTLTILSTAERGGSTVLQEFDIPIRFTPAPSFLAVSLALGIVLGLTLRALITKRLDWLDFALQALLAIVVWLFLIFVKIKASILGYDLDPTSLGPAGLITLLVAGGSSVGSKIAEAIRKS